MRTLDRVVSLDDYENFALAFAGIDKALATWTWLGRTRGVFLTVAGAGGTVFSDGDATVVDLVKALQGAGNPYVPIRVRSSTPYSSRSARRSRSTPPLQTRARDGEGLAVARLGLLVWGAAARARVAQSEVVAAVQKTPGVTAVG